MAAPIRTASIDARRHRLAGSAALHRRARNVVPDGVTQTATWSRSPILYARQRTAQVGR